MKRILFVCTGNTCRSPMAEIILKTKFKLAGITDIRVSSAGLNTLDGQKISKYSKEALKRLGYKAYGFKSKQINDSIIKRSDMIICMTKSHKDYLQFTGKAYTLGELVGLCDIIDPYGGDLSLYVKTSMEIEDACNKILYKICKVLED